MYIRDKNIKELPDEQKPREKMLKHGAEKLLDEELLAVVLGSGTKEKDVLALADEVLKTGWKRLMHMSVQEIIQEFRGIGEAKACQIKAVVELAKRIFDPYEGILLNNPDSAYRFLKDKVDDRKEYLIGLYLSPSNRLIAYETVAIGRMNALHAEPKEILYHAISNACYGIILAHNHPKGELKPSREDIDFTHKVKKACEIMGFELLDHLILTKKGYLSFKKEGYL